jgi:hypothetical protein
MKKNSTTLLQILVVLVALGALAFLLWEPQVEGVNAHATLFEIYFTDPFLAFAYIGSIPFFVALYQAFKVFGYMRHDPTSSSATLKALRTIKYCMGIFIGFIVIGEAYIGLQPSDDRAGGVAMGAFIILCSLIIAAVAATYERKLRPSS